jgi:hypothetical protein
MIRKCLAVGIILLFVLLAGSPILGVSYYRDDTTPPVTTISFIPPEPSGQNGWYVYDVTVILNASDNDSGVNVTKYRIDKSTWKNYTEPFILSMEGRDIQIEYFSMDNAGNIESVKNATIDIDKTTPIISSFTYTWGGGNPWYTVNFTLCATASDDISGLNRAEFYILNTSTWNMELKGVITGPGPIYTLTFPFPCYYSGRFIGLIRNAEVTSELVNFYARAVLFLTTGASITFYEAKVYVYDTAGWCEERTIYQPSPIPIIFPKLYLSQNVTLPNNYKGFIGKSFLYAKFYSSIFSTFNVS